MDVVVLEVPAGTVRVSLPVPDDWQPLLVPAPLWFAARAPTGDGFLPNVTVAGADVEVPADPVEAGEAIAAALDGGAIIEASRHPVDPHDTLLMLTHASPGEDAVTFQRLLTRSGVTVTVSYTCGVTQVSGWRDRFTDWLDRTSAE